jgi:shikimate kinase
MTAGKSTIGKILANTIGWNFIDLDEEIERTLNKPINRIFKEKAKLISEMLKIKF